MDIKNVDIRYQHKPTHTQKCEMFINFPYIEMCVNIPNHLPGKFVENSRFVHQDTAATQALQTTVRK